MSTITDPNSIKRFHMLSQAKALRLEGMGIRFRGGSVLAHVKRAYGFRGNRQQVIAMLEGLINQGVQQ
jgi:hypothetical protein